LDAREVAAVFTAPFYNFLKATDEMEHASEAAQEFGVETTASRAQFYRGAWTDWHESHWRMHSFHVPIAGQNVSWASPATSTSRDEMPRFRVFGMTARILVDAARLAFAQEPDFEHNSHFGDEDMIGRLLKVGRLGPVRRPGDELTKEDMVAAANVCLACAPDSLRN
jgi:hypothetical protein